MHTLAFDVAKECGKPSRLGKGRWKCLCPAHADRNPSLAVEDGRQVLLVHCYAGCDRRDVLVALRTMGIETGNADHGDYPLSPPRRPPPSDNAADRIASAGAIWRESVAAPGTLGETYLRGRGLDLLVGPDVARFHPACPRGPGAGGARGLRQAALICLMRDIMTDKPVAIHRRYLNADGSRDGKPFTLGRVGGAAIKLQGDSCCSALHVAEGFESALGAMMLGHVPVWALGSAGEMSRFPVLSGVGELIVLADHDLQDVGIHAAYDAIEHWQAAGKLARGIWPRTRGFDFADVAEARR